MSARSPLTMGLAALALLGGVVAGPGWFLIRGDKLVAEALARRREAAVQSESRAKSWDFWTVAIDNLTSELKEEKARLNQRSDELDQREARLDSEKAELQKLREQIEAMRRDIDERVIAINVDEARNLKSLAQTYSNIQAQDAVAIIRQMSDTTAVKILYLMKPDVVGPIFEQMASSGDPALARRAADLSDKIRLMKAAVVPDQPPGG